MAGRGNGDEMAAVAAHSVLSAVYYAIHATIMSLYTHMLAICQGSHHEAWPHQRAPAGHMAHSEVQPMGRIGL